MKALVVYPAYGRTASNNSELRQHFMEGKDFSPSSRGGGYLSIREFIDNEPALEDVCGAVLVYRDLHVYVTRWEMRSYYEPR